MPTHLIRKEAAKTTTNSYAGLFQKAQISDAIPDFCGDPQKLDLKA